MRTKLAWFTIVCVLLAAGAGTAGADRLPFWLYGNLGYGKWLEDGAPDGGIGLGAGIIYPLEDLPIAVGGELGYVMLGSYDYDFSGGFGGSVDAEASLSAIPILGQAYYMIPGGDALDLYGTLGLGFYNMRWDYDVSGEIGGIGGSFSDSESETEFGINLGAGTRFGKAERPLNFGFDFRYHIIMTENESTNVLTALGRVYFH
ncbi:MAG: outer membrane beta-barrel protein [Candidatus Eisenbacteria bacterium]|nr:outer membrane beta-barrel protein [Candidatus Latescibacterota bacterium]MBD3302127.1 outer membrane beta-barrel protein [Candidatus Eisenbacteria bacterium]